MKFKYEIGEIVQFKLVSDVRVLILERQLHEYNGGTQILYFGRMGAGFSGVSKPEYFREIELEKINTKKSKAGGTE